MINSGDESSTHKTPVIMELDLDSCPFIASKYLILGLKKKFSPVWEVRIGLSGLITII